MATTLTNPGFETGNLTGWTLVPADVGGLENNLGDATVGAYDNGVLSGTYSLGIGGGAPYTRGRIQQSAIADIGVDELELLIYMRGTNPGGPAEPPANLWTARWGIDWYDENEVYISTSEGPVVQAAAEQWRGVRATFNRPSDYAVKGRVFVYVNKGTTFGMETLYFDEASWNNGSNFNASLVQPPDGAEYITGQTVPLSISYTGTIPTIESVEYFADATSLIVSSSAPWNSTHVFNDVGEYDITAVLTMSDASEITVGPHTITVVEEAGDPREYRASNAQAPMIISNFSGVSSSMPATSRAVGIEVFVDYKLAVFGRLKDINVASPSAATPTTVFDAVEGGRLQVNLLAKNGEVYTALGASAIADIPIDRSDFTLEETGVTEGKKWVHYEQADLSQVIVGSETELFGQTSIPAFSFVDYALGITFYPDVDTKPSYASDGDAAYRIMIDKIRVRVYFDAGSVEYYFASPDKTQCIKGILAAAYVLDGDLRTGDASGVLQLTPELEVMDGTQTWIGNDWTIHAAYPPTDANYIGDVADIAGEAELGMEYNGLPTQQQVRDNRSRYLFISENFYGDPDLNSMYGVHGLPRAFAYNGDFFYKIYTQEDPEKDSPRSVANHHTHLALGYHGGRVDISVVGEPYNFNGIDGASSWAFGDKVVGLLPLSGTILGVFGSKSIWGIAGTTVDNFATQVISPNIGAIEYTICDMGFPVYANAYGVYTLSQTQQYGDYLGQPMSQNVSPWLRPRLLRKNTSDKEVVCAWPVRSKNQYRLAFSDGYVASMTLNGQQVPTFSFQKYFYDQTGLYSDVPLYSYPAIVPAALSSELDNHGEERIHVAPYIDEAEYTPTPPTSPMEIGVGLGEGAFIPSEDFVGNPPEWFVWGNVGYYIYNATEDTWSEFSWLGEYYTLPGIEGELYLYNELEGDLSVPLSPYQIMTFSIDLGTQQVVTLSSTPPDEFVSGTAFSITAVGWSTDVAYNEGLSWYEWDSIAGTPPEEGFDWRPATITQGANQFTAAYQVSSF
jgi:hypothetical protein